MAIVLRFIRLVRRMLGRRAAAPPSMYTTIHVQHFNIAQDRARAVVLRVAAAYHAQPRANRFIHWSGEISLVLDPATPTPEIHAALIAAARGAIRVKIAAQGYAYTVGPTDVYRIIGLSIA